MLSWQDTAWWRAESPILGLVPRHEHSSAEAQYAHFRRIRMPMRLNDHPFGHMDIKETIANSRKLLAEEMGQIIAGIQLVVRYRPRVRCARLGFGGCNTGSIIVLVRLDLLTCTVCLRLGI